MPSRAVEPVEQRQKFVPAAGEDDSEPLTTARRSSGSDRLWQFLLYSTDCDRRGQRGRRGRKPLAVGEHEIIDWLPLLDVSMQRERAIARSVEAGLLLAIACPGSHSVKRERTTRRRSLFRRVFCRREGADCHHTEREPGACPNRPFHRSPPQSAARS